MNTNDDLNPLLPDWLYRRALDSSATIAIETPTHRFTYRELFDMAAKFAGTLSTNGVVKGNKVALLCSQGLLFAKGLHAVMQASAIAVPLNFRLTAEELAWQLNHAEVPLLVYDTAFSDLATRIAGLCRHSVQLINIEADSDAATPVYREHVALSEVLAIIYTSGTTGHPKGAMITYGNQWWSAINSALQLGLSNAERWLVPMPLFHVGGMSVLMRSVIYGTTAVVHDRFDPLAVNEALDHHEVSIISVVPVMLQRMLEKRTSAYPATLRCVLLGGSAAPKVLLEQCQKLSVPVAQTYGLTEANSQVTTLRPEDGLRKLGSSGKPLPTTQIIVVDSDGRRAACMEPGEIVVRGPSVIHGYLKEPEATARSFDDGGFKTGDIGYVDEEGYLFVLDRRNDLIVSGGENIYPIEIENVLSMHDNVVEAGVAGRDDPAWGQVPVAFVKMNEERPGFESELEQYCRERLAGYKVPKHFVFVDALPRNASGKLLRRNLREWPI